MTLHGFTYCTCFHNGHCATCRERRREKEERRNAKAHELIEPAKKLRTQITAIQDVLDMIKDTEHYHSQTSAFLQAKLILLTREETALTGNLRPQLDALYAKPLDEIDE